MEATDEDTETSLKVAEEWALSETDIRAKAKEDFIQAGVSEENASVAAELIQAGMEGMADISGTTPLQEYENFNLAVYNDSEALKSDAEEKKVPMSPEQVENLEPLSEEEERYVLSLIKQQEQERQAQAQTQELFPGDSERVIQEMSLEDTLGYYQTGLSEIDESRIYKILPQDLKEAVDFIYNGDPVYDVTGKEFPNTGENLNNRVFEYYRDKYNNRVEIDSFGEVMLDKKSIKNSAYHGMSKEKANAFAAVPEVLKKGKLVRTEENYQGKPENRYLFIAPITLTDANGNKQEYFCEVVVREGVSSDNNGKKRFYLHEVDLKEKLTNVFSTRYDSSTSASSKSIISKLINDVKLQNVEDVKRYHQEETIQINGKERSARNSQGERIARTGEGLRAFYEWFGDSKAVDENGRPLVVYHGTNADFDVFEKVERGVGYWFGTKQTAEGYARERVEETGGTEKVYPVYLRLEKIADISTEKGREELKKFAGEFNDKEAWHYARIPEGNIASFVLGNEDFSLFLKNKGYDGIKLNGGSYVSFFRNNIKSVDNQGSFSRTSDNIYYQSAFHGSPHNELEDGHFSLEKIGTGEGFAAHGYGLYYTSKFDIADLKYRRMLAQPYQKFVSFGDAVYNKKTKKYDNAFNFKSIEYKVYSDYIDAGKDYDTLIKSYKSLENINADIKDRIAIAKKYADKLDDAREFIDDSMAVGQVYEVDLPENPYLLDEQKPVNQQSEHIRKAVRDIMNKYPDEYKSSENYEAGSFGDALTGGSFYKQLMFIAQRNGTSDKIEQMKFASKILEENGIKGITYDGRVDGRCFVIFNPDDVQVIRKFYQQQMQEGRKEADRYISGEELGEYKDANDLRKKAYQYFKDNLQGKYAEHPVLGKIKFIRKGIDKVKSTSADIDKLKLLPKIKEIIETAELIRSQENEKPEKSDIIRFHYLANNVILSGKPIDVFVTVAEDRDGNFFYNINKDNKTPSRVGAKQRRTDEGKADNSALNLTITPVEENVKRGDGSFYRQEEKEVLSAQNQVRGYFEMGNKAGQIIHILKHGDVDTMVHELMHFFTLNRIERAQKAGKENLLQGIMRYYHVTNSEELMRQDIAEDLADKAMVYLTKEEAPTSYMRRFFETFKRWLERFKAALVKNGVIAQEELSPEIKEFFDKMFSVEAKRISLEQIKGQEQQIRDTLKKALKGEAVSFETREGEQIDIRKVRELLSVQNKRLPKKPQTLAQKIRKKGGINKKLAAKFDWLISSGAKDTVGESYLLIKKREKNSRSFYVIKKRFNNDLWIFQKQDHPKKYLCSVLYIERPLFLV